MIPVELALGKSREYTGDYLSEPHSEVHLECTNPAPHHITPRNHSTQPLQKQGYESSLLSGRSDEGAGGCAVPRSSVQLPVRRAAILLTKRSERRPSADPDCRVRPPLSRLPEAEKGGRPSCRASHPLHRLEACVMLCDAPRSTLNSFLMRIYERLV